MAGPDGRVWTVRRRLPLGGDEGIRARFVRRMRRGGRAAHRLGEWVDVPVFDFEGVVFVLAAFAIFLIAALLIVPLLLTVLELFLSLLIVGLALVTGNVLRRRWHVVAVADDGEKLLFAAVGWRRAGRLVELVALRLRAGLPPGADPKDELWQFRIQ